MASQWTEDRIKLLTHLRAKGLSHRQELADMINRQTGSTFTRNSICSMIQRTWGPDHAPMSQAEKDAAVLRRRDESNARMREKRAAARIAAGYVPRPYKGRPQTNATPYIVQDPSNIIPLNINLLDLQEGDCRWPYDAPPGSSISHVFCGHPALKDRPYCVGHTAISTAGIPARKQTLHPAEFGKSRGGVFGRVA